MSDLAINLIALGVAFFYAIIAGVVFVVMKDRGGEDEGDAALSAVAWPLYAILGAVGCALVAIMGLPALLGAAVARRFLGWRESRRLPRARQERPR